jgi:hypothetical protein
LRIAIPDGFTAVPNWLIRDIRLSFEARLLGTLLFQHARNTWQCAPSQEELALSLARPVGSHGTLSIPNRRSVLRWLSELVATGWLTWRRTKDTNEYTLTYPASIEPVKHMFDATHDADYADYDGILVSHGDAIRESYRTGTDGTHESAPSSIDSDRHADSSSEDDGLTDTQMYLEHIGFSPTTAKEFRLVPFSLAQSDLRRRLGSYPEREWVRHIGSIVLAWRKHPPVASPGFVISPEWNDIFNRSANESAQEQP